MRQVLEVAPVAEEAKDETGAQAFGERAILFL